MLGGLGGLNPKKMQAMMKQMGIKQEEIEASRVVIDKTDGDKIVIENPNVMKINMQGQESWQISGDAKEEDVEGIKEEDVQLVVEKTGKSEKEARGALEGANGEIAEAIMALS
jgi:nascent polypeptide-associated complex subunit alpha